MRRSAPYSLSAAANVFCRAAADHLPTTREAVALPNFNEPATRSRSSQQAVISSAFSRWVSSGPALG